MIWWPIEFPTLSTGKIVLRPVVKNDIELIYQACQDPIISKFTTIPPDYPISAVKEFVENRIPQQFAKQTELALAIEEDNKFAGVISLHTIDHANHRAEIGYWIEKSMRGKGICRQAVELLTDYGLLTIGFRRIEAMVNSDNETSKHLLLKAGYQFEGILRQRITNHDGQQVDMAVFAATVS